MLAPSLRHVCRAEWVGGAWRVPGGKPSVKCVFTTQHPCLASLFSVCCTNLAGATCIKVVLFSAARKQCLLAFLFIVTISRAALNCIGYCGKLSHCGLKEIFIDSPEQSTRHLRGGGRGVQGVGGRHLIALLHLCLPVVLQNCLKNQNT